MNVHGGGSSVPVERGAGWVVTVPFLSLQREGVAQGQLQHARELLDFWDRNGWCHFQVWRNEVPIIFSGQRVDSDLRVGHWKLVYKFIWDTDFKLMASWPLKNRKSCINISVYSKIQRYFWAFYTGSQTIETYKLCFPDRHYCLKIFLTSLLSNSFCHTTGFIWDTINTEGRQTWVVTT